ncbi:hypothetical protein JZU68_07340, partial [bacterium]|nr:hypothetical protein [bacterium]
PYMFALNSNGNPVRINQLRWNNGLFPRFQGTSTSYSYTLNNDTFKKLFEKKTTVKTTDTNTETQGENTDEIPEKAPEKPSDDKTGKDA